MKTAHTQSRKDNVECYRVRTPYTKAVRELFERVDTLEESAFSLLLKTIVCYDVFHHTEMILEAPSSPIPRYINLLAETTRFLKAASLHTHAFTRMPQDCFSDDAQKTGSHYGNLFNKFDHNSYFNEPFKLLRTRLTRNNFDVTWCRGKRALDAGCGGGRYTFALKRLGFKRVSGIDFSTPGITHAKKCLKVSHSRGIDFKIGSVLDLPYQPDTFDFVFSNGVLHHTLDTKKGIVELMRVLKPKGVGFLYVIESPGGIFWDTIEILRYIMKDVPLEYARNQMRLLGVPPNRCFYILDHIMVPINIRFTPAEVIKMLEDAGAMHVKRFQRGVDFDRVEHMYQNKPYCGVKFGVGENRFIFQKKA